MIVINVNIYSGIILQSHSRFTNTAIKVWVQNG